MGKILIISKNFNKVFIILFSRSRRKVDINNKERGENVNQTLGSNNAGRTPLSQMLDINSGANLKKNSTTAGFSQAGSAKLARKSSKLDTQILVDTTCVADSIDDELLDLVFRLPLGICRNEWLATQSIFLIIFNRLYNIYLI